MNDGVLFRDRRDAGRRLADALKQYDRTPGVQVLALPRGGVIVADEISRALDLPLDVLVTRKLGAPGNPELAMGALTETGYRHVNSMVMQQYGVSSAQLEAEVGRQQQEIDRQISRYREGHSLPSLFGRIVILIDDGFATGATFLASLGGLRSLGLSHLVAALPVAPPDARRELHGKADTIVILHQPERFFAIGPFYEDFAQTEDDEVIACLSRGRTRGHNVRSPE